MDYNLFTPEYKPTEGGWGWWIVIGYGMTNIIIIPVMQTFGLIFKDTLSQMNIQATQFSTIINLNSAIGMSIGILNGPLLNIYGYRKIAIVGGLFYSFGLFLTSFGYSFAHFIITYSIIASLGTGLSTSSFSLALNTYFLKKRNKAAGFVMTIAGLGPILLPQLVSFLLSNYSSHQTLMIMSAISLNIIVGACLLQPIKWHSKPINNGNLEDKNSTSIQPVVTWSYSDSESEDDYLEYPKKYSAINVNINSQSLYGFDIGPVLNSSDSIETSAKPLVNSNSKWNNISYNKDEVELIYMNNIKSRAQSLSHDHRFDFFPASVKTPNQTNVTTDNMIMPNEMNSTDAKPKERRWFDSGSIATINLGSSVKIFEEEDHHHHNHSGPRKNSSRHSIRHNDLKLTSIGEIDIQNSVPITSHNTITKIVEGEENTNSVPPAKLTKLQILREKYKDVVKLFDFNLLRDKIYLNIMIGISIAIFSEINFSLLTPLILYDLNYGTADIATFMSVLALSDILVRFISPFIGDYFDRTPRIMYMYSMLMLIIGRSCVLLANSYTTMLIVAVGLGFGKGVRSVYMGLVVPSYIPIERLASASGIQMVCNCIFLFSLGPILGYIRDSTGSFLPCILFVNFLTCLTLLMWSIEFIYMAVKDK